MDRPNYIQYNSSNKDYARENRKNPTKAEKVIREKVLRKRQTWYLFLRQKMLWSFIVDFYCSKLFLAIEIDWSSHDDKYVYDVNRTDAINDLWIVVIRYTNEEVLWDIESLREDLIWKLKEREEYVKLYYE
jgi:very-short-patch-repair endonuclease